MSFRTLLLLYLSGLILPSIVSLLQSKPGYLDSDYYFAGGLQLAQGKGFVEPYLWNYLDGTTTLPHPSHTYWMPLASIIAAIGMRLTGDFDYASARLGFIILAAIVPPITHTLALALTRRKNLAMISAVLSIFYVYHAPFLGVTDNFGIYMVFGGLFFLAMSCQQECRGGVILNLFLGVFAGFLSLARTDGLLWLAMALMVVALRHPASLERKPFLQGILKEGILVLLGFLIVMGPWYWRNITVFNSIVAPGGSRVLWLDNYDQTFIYPPESLNMDYFKSLGWKEILSDRLWALKLNLQSGFAAHGSIILFPFILVGVFATWGDARVKLAAIAWVFLFVVMTLVFPFAGARGAFFHAGAALQPMWWSLAPLGLDSMLDFLRRRGLGNDGTKVIFHSAMMLFVITLTVFVVYLRLFALGWGEGEDRYPMVESALIQKGIKTEDIVIVRNAPGYYLETGRSAISIPYGGESAIVEVSRVFGAEYLVLEPEAAIEPLQNLFQTSGDLAEFNYLGEVDGIRLYQINTE